ncbi:flagellar basal body L-ring protein FlgH [Fuchsiella alkaliacetigena]|uniref:flagellar basal body L-ring protein FlgH n=1 Tax=Fuchsiella alkaliacetigena TaxID=957042 RepID=UPI00200A3F06|nr:flagellar basal body L-ring protein FlgH [Fuchsiella alkaliacetigena]MCK8824571.1 flagellar basal body L-ring protein FlgH [Fuchsiella alkaliacetigena]
MKRRSLVVLSLLLVLLLSTTPVVASLYQDSGSIYRDNKPQQEGDLLTVIISEESSASHEASNELEQDGDFDAGAGGGLVDFIRAINLSQSSSSSSSGGTTQSGDLTAMMAVRVVEVFDNGNLKVRGSKEITINNETQRIELSGIVRPDDISIDNTVTSTDIADGRIEYTGDGPIGDTQRPGVLSRFFSWLF